MVERVTDNDEVPGPIPGTRTGNLDNFFQRGGMIMAADERLAPPVQAFGHILEFDNKIQKGYLVFDLWLLSHFVGVYKFAFDRKDLHPHYSQPQNGDRVKMMIRCGYDNQAWCIEDNSLNLICKATLVETANQS